MSLLKIFDVESEGDTVILIPLDVRHWLPLDDLTLFDATTQMPERFRDQINRALEHLRPPEVTNVVVDFKQVSYFGSLMISSLVQIARRVQGCGGKIALCNLTDESVDVLRGLRSLSAWLSPALGWPLPWQICENRQQALEAVSGQDAPRR